MVIGIKPECIEDYKKNHANTWPEVLETISKGNVKNFQYSSMEHYYLDILSIMEIT